VNIDKRCNVSYVKPEIKEFDCFGANVGAWICVLFIITTIGSVVLEEDRAVKLIEKSTNTET
jgi:hypothetical protein